jgi:2,3-bisphosphoglycerate-independent phosphoglycerate mutase
MIFADGVGLGREDPKTNPFSAARLPTLRSLLGGQMLSKRNGRLSSSNVVAVPLNATLGTKGLPQSGTGQTTIFTGVNAAKVIGQHYGPYPHSKLKPLLESRNLFRQLLERGKSACFVNAYPKQFHEAIEKRKLRYTVTTFSAVSSGLSLRGYEELKAGEALAADITGERWVDFGYDHLPILTPEEAGKRFYEISRGYDFTLFEYFLTDHAGHSQNMERAVRVLERLDGFLGGVLENFDYDNSLLLFTSDHGNIEDLSTKSHTRNPVPLLLVGHSKERVGKSIKSLVDITPAIIGFITA